MTIEIFGQKRYFPSVTMPENKTPMKCPARRWTKRAGIIALLFFLAKGLLWLGVLAAGAYYSTRN